jgi:hypothetical protein
MEEEYILAYSSKGFSSWLLGSIASRPMCDEQNIMGGDRQWSKAGHFVADGK